MTTLRRAAAALTLLALGAATATADTLVYRANGQLNFKTELYLAAGPGQPAQPVFGIPPEFGSGVTDRYEVDRRGRTAVALVDTLEGGELWLADLKSGDVRTLSTPLLSGGDVDGMVIGPKGRWIAYRCRRKLSMPYELYLVDVKTGITFPVSVPLVDGGGVDRFAFGPRGRVLVYQARQNADDDDQLFRVDLKTFGTILVSQPVIPGAIMQDWVITRDGRSVVFFGSDDVTLSIRLQRADLTTGEVELIASPINLASSEGEIVCGPRGRALYFSAFPGAAQSAVYRLDLKTNVLTEISSGTSSGEAKGWTLGALDPRGRFVLVQGDGEQTGKQELWKVDLKSLQPLRLSPESDDLTQDVTGPVRIGPQGRFAYYRIIDSAGSARLLRSSIKTGAFETLSSPLNSNQAVLSFAVQPRGRGVAYVSDEVVAGREELWYHDFKTGEVTRLSQEPQANSDVLSNTLSWDRAGRLMRYIGDYDLNQKFELWESDLKSGEVQKVNAELFDALDVFDYAVPGS